MKKVLLLVLLTFISVQAQFSVKGPQHGDVYKEFYLNNNGDYNWRVTSPDAGPGNGAENYLPNPVLNINIDDLQGATKAEILIDLWGGHENTFDKQFRFNGNSWINIPELPFNVKPGDYYMYQYNPIIEVPLANLVEGVNTLEGTSGNNAWDWGQWAWYGIIVRVYYDPATKPHATGFIGSQSDGNSLEDYPQVFAQISSGTVDRVDYLAYYDGYDQDGDGIFEDWHQFYQRESFSDDISIRGHVGTSLASPWGVTWNTSQVPDQDAGKIKLQARIRNSNGVWYVTDAVENLSLVRNSFSLKLFKPKDVPERFWIPYSGTDDSSFVEVPNTTNLLLVDKANLLVRTWNGIDKGSATTSTRINGKNFFPSAYGKAYFFSYDTLNLDKSFIKTGDNSILFRANIVINVDHGIEVLYPGPAFLVREAVNDGVPPTVDVWYGDTQDFGLVGTPQKWVNILGNITDENGVNLVTYTVNGSGLDTLVLGPDTRRLKSSGDFNIDIDLASLTDGSNTVSITAIDNIGNSITKDVTVNYSTGNVWPANYNVDFSTVTNILDVAQPVDGKWIISSEGYLENVDLGYDRTLAIGDTTWNSYEVIGKIRVNSISPNYDFPDYGSGIGFLLRWVGHSDAGVNPEFDPKAGVQPFGMLGWHAWGNTFGKTAQYTRYELINDGFGFVSNTTSPSGFQIGDWYIFKMSVITNAANKGEYKLKVWKDGETEPLNWFVSGTSNLKNGSMLLVAHNCNVSVEYINISYEEPLPVELTSFNVNSVDGAVVLNWATATEVNNYGFEIERNGEKIGFVQGNGNSNAPISYSFTDSDVKSGKYSYRLKQIDFDGKFEYSSSVEIDLEIPTTFELSQNYPNPFNPATTIKYGIDKSGFVKLVVYNILGEEVAQLVNQVQEPGVYNVMFDASNLNSGIYVYRLESGSQTQMKKMMLVK